MAQKMLVLKKNQNRLSSQQKTIKYSKPPVKINIWSRYRASSRLRAICSNKVFSPPIRPIGRSQSWTTRSHGAMKVGPNQRYGSNKVSPPQELHLRTHGWRKILKYMHTSRLAVLVLLGPFCTFFSDLEKSGFKHTEPPRSMLDSTKDKRSLIHELKLTDENQILHYLHVINTRVPTC